MDDDVALFEIEVKQDAIVTDPSAPGRRLSFEASEVALEGIILDGQQGSLNARLLF